MISTVTSTRDLLKLLKTKKPCLVDKALFVIKDRQRLTLPGVILVPSALVGLTSLFGMGRGDPHRYCHLKVFGDRVSITVMT